MIFDGSIGGEFWYKLNLEALDPEEIIMPLVECEVGRYVYRPLKNMQQLITQVSVRYFSHISPLMSDLFL